MNVMKGGVDLDTDTLKATLHTATYTPNQDTHDFYDDATNELSTANGYTSGGVTLGSKAVTYDSTSQQARFDCADLSWTLTGSITFRHVVIRKSRGGAASADELVAYIDMGENVTAMAGTYTLTIDAAGLLYVDVT